MIDKCVLCGIETELTLHHLVPRSKSKNKFKQSKEDPNNHLWICRSCHDQIHALFSNNELRDYFYTKELLLANDDLNKYIAWKKKHPDFIGHSKMSNQRKKSYG